MKDPQPIIVNHLFAGVLDSLVELLASLDSGQWSRPTSCSKWSVKDVALHLLGGEVGILSRQRDAHLIGPSVQSWDQLVALINDLNSLWVEATRRISPRLLCDLLKHTGEQSCEYFSSLDPFAIGGPVDWAGPERAPVWLDIAREYTERWHHQQQIRDAVARPGLKEPRFLAPVLDTFVRALPHTYRRVGAEEGTIVQLTITGESGGEWFIRREAKRWKLYVGQSNSPSSEVTVDQEDAWRLFTRGLSSETASARIAISGDKDLARHAVGMVSVIA